MGRSGDPLSSQFVCWVVDITLPGPIGGACLRDSKKKKSPIQTEGWKKSLFPRGDPPFLRKPHVLVEGLRESGAKSSPFSKTFVKSRWSRLSSRNKRMGGPFPLPGKQKQPFAAPLSCLNLNGGTQFAGAPYGYYLVAHPSSFGGPS